MEDTDPHHRRVTEEDIDRLPRRPVTEEDSDRRLPRPLIITADTDRRLPTAEVACRSSRLSA